MDTRQSSNGNTFITSASSFHLALDALVYLAYTNSDSSGSNSFRHATISVEQYLSYKLCDELSRSTISHIALAIAAIHWSHRRDHPWSYPSFADQLRFQHLIIKNFYVVDKSSILLENVALALSVIDVRHPIQSSDYEPFSTLFTTTSDLFIEAFQEPGKTIPYPHFPQSLLRLARRNPSDYKMLFRIAQLLALCPDGDWASPLHGEYGQDMIHLLGAILSPHSVKFLGSTPGPAFGLLDKMARGSNDGMFLRTIESQDGLLQYRHEAIRLTAPLFIRGCGSEFGKKVLLLRGTGNCSSALLETQISLVMAILTKGSWLWDPIHNAVAVFFNQMLEDDGDLHWPTYFISLGIIQSDTHFTKVESAARLRFIEPSKLVELSSSYQWFGSGGVAREWYGEAVLLMWKKARKELSQGCPSSSWEESTFFTTSAVQIMLQYHKHVQYHKHDGVERGLLKDYLERALLASEAEATSHISVAPVCTMAQPSASEPKPLPKPEVSTIVLKYQERHVLVPRPLSYGDVISFIRRNLLNNEDDNIRILARVPGRPDSVDEEVEITRDAWDMVAPSISTFTVATSNDQRENLGGGGDQPAPQNPAPPMPQGDLYIDLPIGRTVPISIDLMDTIGYLKIKIQQSQNVLPFQQVLHFGDVQLEDGRTCASYGLQKGDRVTLFINRNIRKPVIYLYPPTSIDATVTLSLVPHWRFSILYPPTAEKDVKVGDQVRQQVQWNVTARPDGELTDKDSGIDVAYLFWEAEPCSIFTLPDSPPSSPTATAPAKVVSGEKGDNFIPGLTKCTPKDSVVLPGSQVATYLDKALTELGLHPEARTSFIT
ncbi:hypothetical protein FRC03_005048 [Tulasnella sp. 419]|nr:hypothetical protein FRC03_005048 [Tulasnella sp. 419]